MLNVLSDYTCLNIIKDKTGVEGGYVNDPNDNGGETNHGITAALAAQYKPQLSALFHWDGTMRNLSLDMANWMYKTHFWDKMLLDQVLAVHPLIADKLFDIGINTGKVPAVSMLQTFLNIANNKQAYYADIVVDGGLGNGTLAALKAYVAKRGQEGIQRLLIMLLCSQGAYYRDITLRNEKQETFLYGWAGRVTRDVGHYSKLLAIAV